MPAPPAGVQPIPQEKTDIGDRSGEKGNGAESLQTEPTTTVPGEKEDETTPADEEHQFQGHVPATGTSAPADPLNQEPSRPEGTTEVDVEPTKAGTVQVDPPLLKSGPLPRNTKTHGPHAPPDKPNTAVGEQLDDAAGDRDANPPPQAKPTGPEEPQVEPHQAKPIQPTCEAGPGRAPLAKDGALENTETGDLLLSDEDDDLPPASNEEGSKEKVETLKDARPKIESPPHSVEPQNPGPSIARKVSRRNNHGPRETAADLRNTELSSDQSQAPEPREIPKAANNAVTRPRESGNARSIARILRESAEKRKDKSARAQPPAGPKPEPQDRSGTETPTEGGTESTGDGGEKTSSHWFWTILPVSGVMLVLALGLWKWFA